ncbi:AAA family ATPase [Ilumatobacter sp.]|uniref:AAA family ATPase n=1 Tax=Ilumatobacter sp. TaxID=1967498 RepID=UPI003B5176B4
MTAPASAASELPDDISEAEVDAADDPAALVRRLASDVVGRVREIELAVAAISSDRHIVIEGPPGTGKSTLLRAIARELGIGFEFVEGNAELTPARVVGHFDPARVLSEGYDPEVFVPGPLAAALRDGSLLYIEELNRVPEETLNVLITVMSEREITVPRLGRLVAAPGFRMVAAMNPFDAVGTARISGAVSDRMCRIAVGYQSSDDETSIVQRALATHDDGLVETLDPDTGVDWCDPVVELVRATRSHPDLRVGSSVRGAIDMVFVAHSLGRLRGAPPTSPSVSLDAALVALSGRVRVREGSSRTAEDVITELWESIFHRVTGDGGGGSEGKASAPNGATRSP